MPLLIYQGVAGVGNTIDFHIDGADLPVAEDYQQSHGHQKHTSSNPPQSLEVYSLLLSYLPPGYIFSSWILVNFGNMCMGVVGYYHAIHPLFSLELSLIAALSLALRARGFSATSPGRGVIGFLVRILISGTWLHLHTGNSGGQIQPWALSRKSCLTILSSREWYEITTITPPGTDNFIAASKPWRKLSNSALTAMRKA